MEECTGIQLRLNSSGDKKRKREEYIATVNIADGRVFERRKDSGVAGRILLYLIKDEIYGKEGIIAINGEPLRGKALIHNAYLEEIMLGGGEK